MGGSPTRRSDEGFASCSDGASTRSRPEVPSAAQKQMQLIERMRAAPVALVPDAANAQHYEIPVEFFEHVLGPHLKYSSAPTGPIRILTHLRYFGYVFNPVSFYFCYDGAVGHVETIVAEITNTPWGERHCYVLGPGANQAGDASRKAIPTA